MIVKYLSKLHYLRIYRLISDQLFIKIQFRRLQGYTLNLKTPKTINEKIQWLKLYDRTSLHTLCADKYLVRDYVTSKIDEKYLVPLVQVAKSTTEINPNTLPDYPVIIKTNHDSGTCFIIRDQFKEDWNCIKKNLNKSLKRNFYYKGREWQYKNIKPLIVIEKLLMDSKGEIPMDYKVHCFNGTAMLISIDVDRNTPNHCRNWYDKDWNSLSLKWSSKYNKTFEEIEKPNVFNEMISLSEILSKDFIYVRVDWYNVEDKLYFGELTFHHDSGFLPIEPLEWDLKIGNMLDLPKVDKLS